MNLFFGKKSRLLFAILLAALVLLTGQAAANDRVQLTVVSVNDFHGALAADGKNPGAANLAGYLKGVKAHMPNVILLSAGDMFQGSVDSNLLYGKPVMAMMNEVGFDAMTLGNHEFDWGIDVLQQRIAEAHFPIVCANVTDVAAKTLLDGVKPYVLLERDGVKIAVIGLATPETAYKSNPKVVAHFSFADPVQTVNGLTPGLKQQGVQVVLVLTHLASWQDKSGKVSGEAADLAEQAQGIDAVVSGHSHQTVAGLVNGIPVVQAYCYGRAAGIVELHYDKTAGKAVVDGVKVAGLPFPGLTADEKVQRILGEYRPTVESVKKEVAGYTRYDLSHDRTNLSETVLGQWITNLMLKTAGADIAFQNAGGLRTGIPAGDVTMGKLYEVLPFDNTLFTVELTGSQVMAVLETGIMNLNVGMLQYAGLHVTYDLAQRKIAAVSLLNGEPLQPDKTYKVVTNDFMAAGGDGFTTFADGTQLHDTCIPLRDMVAGEIKKQKMIEYKSDNRWEVK